MPKENNPVITTASTFKDGEKTQYLVISEQPCEFIAGFRIQNANKISVYCEGLSKEMSAMEIPNCDGCVKHPSECNLRALRKKMVDGKFKITGEGEQMIVGFE